MIEAEWLASSEPLSMFGLMSGCCSERKLRLAACACYETTYRLWGGMGTGGALQTLIADVIVAERFADGIATPEELTAARAARRDSTWQLIVKSAFASARDVLETASDEVRMTTTAADGLAPLTALLRDVWGNPFRPPPRVEPAWLTWQGGTVERLARSIYEERRFANLPVLADALEEAGCTDADILDHCRGLGPHVRGCWVVDLLLGNG
jgi:hypothetical protein